MAAQPNVPCVITELAGDATVARFRGESLCLDETSSPPAGEVLSNLADQVGAGTLRLNLANVTYMSSAGLGILISLHKKLRAAGGTLVLCGLRPAVHDLFASTRLNELFRIDGKAP